jgi:hypothetical protein
MFLIGGFNGQGLFRLVCVFACKNPAVFSNTLMDVRVLAAKHGGISDAVVGKAQEFLRMLDLKLQNV